MNCNTIKNYKNCKENNCLWVEHSHKKSYCRKPTNSKIVKTGCNSVCNEGDCNLQKDCLWVVPSDKNPYCRSRNNKKLIPEETLELMSNINCKNIKQEKICQKKNNCIWVKPGNKKEYCRKTSKSKVEMKDSLYFFNILDDAEEQWQLIQSQNKIVNTKKIYNVDLGGGGSCLYYSIAGGFCELVQNYQINEHCQKYQTLYEKLLGNKGYLRKIVARMLTEEWLDEHIKELGYEDHQNVFLWQGCGFDQEIAAQIASFEDKQKALKLARKKKLDLGTYAGEFDINMLRDYLDIGFFIINPNQVAKNKVFYCNNLPKQYNYYILLHNLAYVGSGMISFGWHFTLAGIYIHALNKITGGVSYEDLPKWFITRYNQECVSDRLEFLRNQVIKIKPFTMSNKKKCNVCENIYYQNPKISTKKFIETFLSETES